VQALGGLERLVNKHQQAARAVLRLQQGASSVVEGGNAFGFMQQAAAQAAPAAAAEAAAAEAAAAAMEVRSSG